MNDITLLEKDLKANLEHWWIKKGEDSALRLFHEMSVRVPAYKDFLKENGISHEKIKTIEDFQTVPPIDKQNYLRKYPREMLCWDGEFRSKRWTISTTSG